VSDADEADGITSDEHANGGGDKNIVKLLNKQDGRLRVRGNVQLNQISGPNVASTNVAVAYASCSDCQTFAIALQINLISKTATSVTPVNAAVALNYQCTNCYTVARAIQYTYSVDDPTQVPQEVTDLIKDLDHELNAIHADKNLTADEAEARINAVIAQFQDLAQSFDDQRDETAEPTTPGAQPVGTPEPTTTPTTATPDATPSEAATSTPTASPQVSATDTPKATATVPPTATETSTSALEPTSTSGP